MDTSVLEDWLQVASDHLYNLTNRQWPGRCERTERPCGAGGCYAGLPLAPNTPLSLIGALRASPWPYRDDRPTCGCSALSSVRLDAEPVVEILEVKVDGEVVPADEYRIDNGRYLTGLWRPDGTLRAWPSCQLLELAETEPGTFCADEATEILTADGWKRYDELTVGEEVYTLDTVTRTARFEPLLAINVFPAAPRQMRRLETANFSSLTTLNHRWPVWQQDHRPRMVWRTSADLAASSAIIRAAPRADAQTEAKWSDAFVELVAWYWTEGSLERSTPRACIAQSEVANPQHVAAIRASLQIAFPGGWSESLRPDGMVYFRLNRGPTRALCGVTTAKKAPTPEFVRTLTTAQLRLFIERCIDGDGHRQTTGTRYWYQVDDESIRTFEMACALAGISTNTGQPRDYGNRMGRVPQVVTLLASSFAKPVDAARVAAVYADRPHRNRNQATDTIVTYDGLVWCPTTQSGTWLARRRGTVYFTGNSVTYSYGAEPPLGGIKAAAVLACQLALSADPAALRDGRCRLPKRVTTISRQGVTLAILDTFSVFADGLTGIPEVDLWISTVRYGETHRRATMSDPTKLRRWTRFGR